MEVYSKEIDTIGFQMDPKIRQGLENTEFIEVFCKRGWNWFLC